MYSTSQRDVSKLAKKRRNNDRKAIVVICLTDTNMFENHNHKCCFKLNVHNKNKKMSYISYNY